MNKLFKNFTDQNGNNLKKFFDDREKIITQFKALYAYTGNVSREERKQFHLKNYRRAFSVCRNALDQYQKRSAKSIIKKEAQSPNEIIECLSRLCKDIPHLVKQSWNHNALSELCSQFLNFNTREDIRLRGVNLMFIIINAGKDLSRKVYIELLQYSMDFTPYCIEAPYENYYNNFKQNLIVGMYKLLAFLICNRLCIIH